MVFRKTSRATVGVMPLRTLAVDFNSYFASCEQQEDPRLRGRAVGVVPVMAETSCVIAASYPAKARGVKVGTGAAEARLLCPGIELVEARPELYVRYHRQLSYMVRLLHPLSLYNGKKEVF